MVYSVPSVELSLDGLFNPHSSNTKFSSVVIHILQKMVNEGCPLGWTARAEILSETFLGKFLSILSYDRYCFPNI